ncbi:MAG: hypothetical protein KDK30_01875 [Leptospiraceae bacterium]|nr:hypothetical protein [Leptospiraceae bacterium]
MYSFAQVIISGSRIARNRSRKQWASIVFIFGLVTGILCAPSGVLTAQSLCYGAGCNVLPLSQTDLNSMLLSTKVQYADPLARDMSEATAVANIPTVPLGSITMNGFSVGAGADATYKPEEDVTVYIPNVGTISDLKTVGFGVNGRFQGGLNLGQILDAGRDNDPFSASRFEVWLSGLEKKHEETELDTYNTLQGKYALPPTYRASVYSRALDVRYHIFEEKGSVWLGWSGLSVLTGVHSMRQDLYYRRIDSKARINLVDNVNLLWDGIDIAEMRSRFDTYPLELQTGFRLLYVLGINLGGGMAWHKGSTNFQLTRTGLVYPESDLLSIIGINDLSTGLLLRMPGDGSAPARMAFFRAGLTLHLWAFKIDVEGMQSGNTKTVAGNIRFEMDLD